MTLYVRQQKSTDVKNRILDSVGEGEGEMIWENSIETCILPYVKQTQKKKWTWEIKETLLDQQR